MKDDTKRLDDTIDTFAAMLSDSESHNTRYHYLLLHRLREEVQIYRADASDYIDPQFGVLEDILSRAIQSLNSLYTVNSKRWGKINARG